MSSRFEPPVFELTPCPELAGGGGHYPVVVLGAGPVGLCMAVDLALNGVPTVVLEARGSTSDGSRAVCWAKRTLEICDRLGAGAPLVERGVTWHEGQVFLGDEEIYRFDLQPEPGHRRPAFVNLQQFYFEDALAARAAALDAIDLRWRHRVAAVEPGADGVTLAVETEAGDYTLDADWLVACDGVRSPTRRALGLDFAGRVFEENFLITDIEVRLDLPAVRRFWFRPTFFDGQSALMHKQADNVWRLDFQLGPETDPEVERRPERVIPRVRRMVGDDIDFELVWTSVYTFTCRRMARFRHGRVFFAGDSAHVVSPFGARGGNGGVQDADNLAWKLAAVIAGTAPEALLDSYDDERVAAADENIVNSTRATDFMTPKSAVSRAFRDAALALARHHGFARQLVNSGRLSVPATYAASPLNTPDADAFDGAPAPGAPAADAPVAWPDGGDAWLLEALGGAFQLLLFAGPDGLAAAEADLVAAGGGLDPPVVPVVVAHARGPVDGATVVDRAGLAAQRYDAAPGTACLLRPDQHIAARWRAPAIAAVAAALDRALARG